MPFDDIEMAKRLSAAKAAHSLQKSKFAEIKMPSNYKRL